MNEKCPNCGYCPCCKRSNWSYPNYWQYPYYSPYQPYWYSYSGIQASGDISYISPVTFQGSAGNINCTSGTLQGCNCEQNKIIFK